MPFKCSAGLISSRCSPVNAISNGQLTTDIIVVCAKIILHLLDSESLADDDASSKKTERE
jgi:hypothetical protein